MTNRTRFPDFAWAVGEEGSDPVVLRDAQPLRHDLFAASAHYDHLEADLAAVAALGVRVFRYGMPWRLTETRPGHFDWGLWDRALAACERAGLEPVIDLCHFGLPDHYAGFLDPSWVEGFCRYVDGFLARYSRPRWFTPVNEPGITAFFSCRVGGWNDRRASPAEYGRALSHIVLANLEAVARVRADRDGWWIGAEGFPVPVAVTPGHDAEVARLRALGWLVWDLHFGLEPTAVCAAELAGMEDRVRSRIADLATRVNTIAGHDFYPASLTAVGGAAPAWTVPQRIDLYADEARRWHARYDLPFWIAETSNLTLPVSEQVAWLDAFAARLAAMRGEGLPVRGLCWYSRGDQFDWQTALLNPVGAVTEVGLFDVHRKPRPVAQRLAEKIAAGSPRA